MPSEASGFPRKRTQQQRDAAFQAHLSSAGEVGAFVRSVDKQLDSPVSEIVDSVSELASASQLNPFVSLNSQGVFAGFDVNSGVGPLQFTGAGAVAAVANKYAKLDCSSAIKVAKEFADSDDLLSDLIDIKLLFTTSGFQVQPKPPKDADIKQADTVRQSIDDSSYRHNLAKVALDLAKDYITCDSMILYWKIASADDTVNLSRRRGQIPGLIDICALNPADVEYDNTAGEDIMLVRIPGKVEGIIRAAINKKGGVAEILSRGIPQKWIDAVAAFIRNPGGKKYPTVKLLREEGDNWVVVTKERKHFGLASPRMKTIFMALETRKSLGDGEYLAAYILQHLIMLIKQGESIESGPNTGSRNNWLKPAEAVDLVKVFSTVSKASRIAVNHTTKIEYITPPPESFSTQKYESCELKIFNWAGVDRGVTTGDAGTYAGGFIGIKKLVASIGHVRDMLSWMFCEFYTDPDIAARVGIPDDYKVTCVFNQNVLKEPAQLLKEIESLLNRGAIDPITALSELGRDPGSVRALKLSVLDEIKDTGVWLNLPDYAKYFLAKALGLDDTSSGGGGKGRPPNDGTTPNEHTRMQRPSAQS